jgi:4-hydroxyproline epimerase
MAGEKEYVRAFVSKLVYNYGMPSSSMNPKRISVVDSHTAGEPTRIVVRGGPDLGEGSMEERLASFRQHHDAFRATVVMEPRGSEVIVGALLCKPIDPAAVAGVIFFNDVGYLGMCGHGTIGLVTTLAHLGRIQPGVHQIETPVGSVHTELHMDGSVSVRNVPSYRYRSDVEVDVIGYGRFMGDIAWGGNWFFLVADHGQQLRVENRAILIELTAAIRTALVANDITGQDGALIDHIELFAAPADAANSSRNFVLCPGASFDRSPCGTGTSAKMACLYASGRLADGEIWRQEGILGTVFTGSVQSKGECVVPTITGRAWITAESDLLCFFSDPFREGIQF